MQKKVWIKGIKVIFFAVACCVMGSAFDASGITKGYAGENATRGVLEISGSATMADVQADPVVEFVNRMYRTILEREPDAGSQTWITVLKDGSYTGVDVADGFIMSDEFLSKSMSNEEFVRIMYRAFFGREADAEGLATWTGYLDNGYIKKFVFAGFANSDEFQTLCDSYGITRGHIKLTMAEETPNLTEREFNVWQFVDRLYSEVLGRTPDASGMATWSGVLLSKEYSGAKVAEGFILSDEFLNKSMTNEEYVQILYRAFFGRTADLEGLATWTNELNNGAAKQFVFAGFANSAEFGNLCESYGIERGSVVANVPEKPYKIVNEVDGVGLSWRPVENVELYGVWRSEKGAKDTYQWLCNLQQTEYVDTAVESGKNYSYRITCYDADTQAHGGASESVTLLYLATPEIISRNNVEEGLALTWTKVEGATGYEIYRSFDYVTPSWNCVYTVEGEDCLSWTDTETASITVYYYTVCAIGGTDGSVSSSIHKDGWRAVRLEAPTHMVSWPELYSDSVVVRWYGNSFPYSLEEHGYEVWIISDTDENKEELLGTINTGMGNALLYSSCAGLAEFGIYAAPTNALDLSAGQSLFPLQTGLDIMDAHKLDAFRGELSLRMRTYAETINGEIFYSPWSESQMLVTPDELEERVAQVVAEFEGESDIEKAMAIYKWIICNVEYRMLPGSTDAESVLVNEFAVCEGYADLFCFLAERAGLEAQYVAGYPEAGGTGHAWNQVKIDGKWYNLDATWGDRGEEFWFEFNLEDYISFFDMFLLSTEHFNRSHYEYSVRSFEYECPESYDIYAYLVQRDVGENGVYVESFDKIKEAVEQKIQAGYVNFEVWHFDWDSYFEGITEINETLAYVNEVLEMVEVSFDMKLIISDVGRIPVFGDVDEVYMWEITALRAETTENGTRVVIPDGVTRLTEALSTFLFDYRNTTTSVEIPDSVARIENNAFEWSGLESIRIPDSVTYLGELAFNGCSKLKEIHLPDGLKGIEWATFSSCSSLKSITIPEGVTYVGDNAFQYCTALQQVELPESLTTIGDRAFNCCAIKEIRIPDSVTSIGERAFADGAKVTVYCKAGSYAETYAKENGIAYVTE